MVKIVVDPCVQSALDIRLFRNVKNVPSLRKKLLSGEISCCLVNPQLILDPLQIVVAANKALTAENRTTKTLFTEILFNLSISKNITQSLQKFGVTDDCKDVIVVTVDNNKISSEIEGSEADLKALDEIRNVELIKKTYKISGQEEKACSLLDSVVSRIATKDFITH